MKSSITKVVRIALFAIALGVAGWAPASAQVTCGSQTISGQTIAEALIVDAGTGTCALINSTVNEGVEVVSGTLSTSNSIIFGDISAAPGTSIIVTSTSVFGKISAEEATAITVANSKVGDGLESKQSGDVAISGSTLAGIKSEQEASIMASDNVLGDKVEVKDTAWPVRLLRNTVGEVTVEKASGIVTIGSNTAFSTIKVVGNTGATTVNGNTTPKLECSSNNGLSKSGNIVLEDKCLN